tara:strand:- start:421 stop:2139 length:1719 start_codon:yes stop_codon:yes gene_type:complete
MCGFVVAYGENLEKKLNFKKFLNAANLVKHRGPDFDKHQRSNNFFLYHSRLSIVDLDKRSNQPFHSQNGRYILIYNGEIYNYLDIKKKLSHKYNFKTSSDTEVLLAAYIEWGKDVLKHIDGMFSFIVIDKKEKIVFFARDLFGQKPLYYKINKNFILFSSEIKPLLKLSDKKEINYSEIENYLAFNFYSHNKNTFFKSIHQIKPGHYGIYENKKIKLLNYSSFSNFQKNFKTKSKIFNSNQLISILTKSSKEHLMGDVNVGLAVSSGLDSLSLLALLKNTTLSEKLSECFTLDYGKDFSEFSEARKLVSKFGMKTNKVTYSHKEMIRDFEKLINFNEAPIGGVMHLGMSKLCKYARQKGIKVLFNGTGLDEVLLGYESSIRLYKSRSSSTERDLTLIDGSKINIGKILKKKRAKTNNFYLDNLALDLLLISKLPKNLHMLDRASMMHSVEMRSPYVNKDIFNYFLNLKFKDFFEKNLSKLPLRESLNKIFPKFNWYTQKKYIQTPQNNWMRKKESKEFFGDIVVSQNKFDQKLFSKKEVVNYWDKFLKNKLKSGLPIWQYTNIYFIEKLKLD